ncbi:MAG: DUF1080 domain-containing protein, partial [Verrucomicrobia bacterium]|nr:DUF1080 domain-containing protein [Verrucomicrobiota bacterium]
ETTELTQTGTAMGSPHYISPEQATVLKDVDFRTDIYSLGCTLYHMLTGQTPYTGDSSMIVMMKHVNDPPPAIFKTWPTCPMPLGMLVGKMLSKDRNARPQSYEQLVDDLMAVHEKLKNLESVRAVAVTPAAPQPKSVTPAVQATVAARPSAKPRSSKAIYATAGAAAVVAIAGLMLWSPWKTREEESGKGQAAKPVSAAVSSAVPAPSAGEAVKMPALPVETAATPPKSSALLAETGAAREAEPTPPKFSTLFDGRDTSAWQHGDSSPCKWRVEDGALVAGATDLDTREKFQDFELHIEFACPQDRKQGNSGVYIQGRYELQILESFGKPATDTSCGSIYKLKAPEQNASKPPDEWQTFDITFHAGRFDAAGSKTANARVSVVHNGTTIQRDVEIPRSSGKGEEESAAPGPIRLQAYGSPVRFRNIRISPLVPATVATPKKTRRVLVFCRCDGFVHRDGIAAANKAIEEMGKKSGAFETDISSDYEALDAAKLAGYDAVVLNNTTKLKIPDDAKKQALLDFVRGGKGLVGIHAATDNFNEDPPLAKLIGGIFDGHPWGANGTWAIKLDEPAHPLCRAFEGRGFKLRDEIYQLKEPYVRADRRVLLSLDLSDPVTANVRGMKREDKDFAIAWIKNEGKGRVFYCGLG